MNRLSISLAVFAATLVSSQISLSERLFDVSSGVQLHIVTAVSSNRPDAGTGRTYVLLHGYPEGWLSWIHMAPELLSLDPTATLIMPDQVCSVFVRQNIYPVDTRCGCVCLWCGRERDNVGPFDFRSNAKFWRGVSAKESGSLKA